MTDKTICDECGLGATCGKAEIVSAPGSSVKHYTTFSYCQIWYDIHAQRQREDGEMARTKKTEVPKFELPKTEYEHDNKVLARTFRSLYNAFLNEGFTEKQAMSLVKAIISSPAIAKPQISMF